LDPDFILGAADYAETAAITSLEPPGTEGQSPTSSDIKHARLLLSNALT